MVTDYAMTGRVRCQPRRGAGRDRGGDPARYATFVPQSAPSLIGKYGTSTAACCLMCAVSAGNLGLCKKTAYTVFILLIPACVSRLVDRVIPLLLIAACITLSLSLDDIMKSPGEKRHHEVREAWRKTTEATIQALQAEELAEAVNPLDAAQAARASKMDLLERRLHLKVLRLKLYMLSHHHQIGDDVLREVLGKLNLSEANLRQVK